MSRLYHIHGNMKTIGKVQTTQLFFFFPNSNSKEIISFFLGQSLRGHFEVVQSNDVFLGQQNKIQNSFSFFSPSYPSSPFKIRLQILKLKGSSETIFSNGLVLQRRKQAQRGDVGCPRPLSSRQCQGLTAGLLAPSGMPFPLILIASWQ